MRSIHQQWKNRRSGFTHRITWYQDRQLGNIRLQLETPDGRTNQYPKDRAEAEAIWSKFIADHKGDQS